MKKKHGWIRQANNTNNFVIEGGFESKHINEAFVYDTRYDARTCTNPHKLDVDIVRKVRLNKKGQAVEIIPGR